MRPWAFASAALLGTALLGTALEGYAEERKLDLKKIADKITSTINGGDPVAVTKLYTQDAVMIQSNEPEPVRGHAALLKSYQGFFKAFPGVRTEFPTIMFSGDTIIFEGVCHGTFTGPLATPDGDVAPTGKSFKFPVVFLAKISPDGLIAEDRSYFDNLAFMKQLGLIKQ
jgi:predicted ester cyclase